MKPNPFQPTAAVVGATESERGDRIASLLLCYPRFIHPQILRHRSFAHSVQSSRAVSVKRSLEWLEQHGPVTPIFTEDRSGMQEGKPLVQYDQEYAAEEWAHACNDACFRAKALSIANNVHHSLCNRLLEPFLPISHLMTGTLHAWNHFLELRSHESADVHAQALAQSISAALDGAEWSKSNDHIPFRKAGETQTEATIRAFARAARVSYLNYEKDRSLKDEAAFISKLWADEHFSPFEHVAEWGFGKRCYLFNDRRMVRMNDQIWRSFRNEADWGVNDLTRGLA